MQMLIAVASQSGTVGKKKKKEKSIVALGVELGLVIAARINYAKHSPNIGRSYRKTTHRETQHKTQECDAVDGMQ